jgi:hypothetical protein
LLLTTVPAMKKATETLEAKGLPQTIIDSMKS